MKTWLAIIAVGVFVCVGIMTSLASQQTTALTRPVTVGWREDFSSAVGLSKAIPKDWTIMGKPGTRPAVFSVTSTKDKNSHLLHLEAYKGSGSLLYQLKSVDLAKTPVLRWRWRATVLPSAADGRIAAKDDQAIGIYMGTGNMLNKKSISYRWDTETPKGAEGNVSYGGGTVKVKWYTLRNKDDGKNGQWFIEERNFAEDFKNAWGFYPENVYVGISCNSQYTSSTAAADLDWIELVSLPNTNIRQNNDSQNITRPHSK